VNVQRNRDNWITSNKKTNVVYGGGEGWFFLKLAGAREF
jgi:hypothetical protein